MLLIILLVHESLAFSFVIFGWLWQEALGYWRWLWMWKDMDCYSRC